MILIKIPISLVIVFVYGIQFCITQDDSFLTSPWIDVVQAPDTNPVIIALNSSCVTPVPNTFNRFLSYSDNVPWGLYNSGKSLYINLCDSTPCTDYSMGGALGLNEYEYHSSIFLWDLNLGNAGATVDGVGSPLQIIKFYSNEKYTAQDASNYRDGWFLQNIRVKVVDGAPYSDTFATFAEKMNKITQPGTNVTITGADLEWYRPSTVRLQEYCYPGSILSPSTNQVTNSATVCVTLDEDLATVSQSQFLDIFGSLLNEDGESFSNIRALQNISPDTPIGVFGPVIDTIQPVS